MAFYNKRIPSEMKTWKIQQKGPIDPASYAWIKLFREKNKTKKVYDINPYVEVYQLRDNLYVFYADNLDDAGDTWMYLIVGPEKAMLIDTAYGLGDTKALCDMLTGGKELIVVNTHPHCDHMYGDCRFDKVYVHEYAVNDAIQKCNPYVWDYLFDENGNHIWVEFDRNDLPEFKRFEIIGVPDGHIFDLGDGYEVEVIHFPGHHRGQAGYLDKRNKIFFSGDSIHSGGFNICGTVGKTDTRDIFHGGYYDHNDPTVRYGTVTELRNAFVRLANRIDEIDNICTGHFITDVDSSVIFEYIKACDKIIADPTNVSSYNPVTNRYTQIVKGFGTITYPLNGV